MSDLNDPRVLYAAERTLLAWTRTALALMAFGFAIERFGLFLHMVLPQDVAQTEHSISNLIGISLLIFGAIFSGLSVWQYRISVKALNLAEIPDRYPVNLTVWLAVGVTSLGVVMALYLALSRIA